MAKYRFRKPLTEHPNDKVSIVLVTYQPNRAQLSCALFALQAQTHENFEVFVVHDGESHAWNLDNILYMQKLADRRFRFFTHAEHTGDWGYHIRSLYESKCDGDWIGGFCDDDWCSPVYLEELLHCVHEAKASFAQCDYLHNYTEWDQIIESKPFIGHVGIGGWIAKSALVMRHPHRTFGEAADGDRVQSMGRDEEFKHSKVKKALFVHG